IGFFVNSLVIRIRVNPDASFRDLLGAVRNTTLDAYLYQDIPFERLVDELAPERRLDETPVFQVVFALHNAPPGPQQVAGLEIAPLLDNELRVRFDLEVHAVEHESGLEINWLYNRDLFDCWRIEHMVRHYVRLLSTAVTQPDVPLYRLGGVDDEERR